MSDETPSPVSVPSEEQVVSPEIVPTPTIEQESAGEARLGERPTIDYGPNYHIELTRAVFDPLGKKETFDAENAIALIDSSIDEFNTIVESYPDAELGNSEQGQRWLNVIESAQAHLLRSRALVGALARENSIWHQIIKHGDSQMSLGRPTLAEKSGSGPLTGEAAMMQMQHLLGLGSVVRVPLWHTGIWLSLRAPGDDALHQLEQLLAHEKITLGRQSNGLIFSSTSIYTTIALLDFVIDHVYDASFKYNDRSDLKNIITITDIPTVLWAMLCAQYPSGYQYQKACIVDPTVCQHVVEERINLTKLSWTDDRRLTPKQRGHMANRSRKYTLEEIKAYQDEHDFSAHTQIEIAPHVRVQLRVPTIADYQQSGYKWISAIVHQADQAFNGNLTGQARNDYITNQGQLTALRQYAHWIERIVFMADAESTDLEGEGNRNVVDRNTLENLVATMTGNDQAFKAFFDGIGSFIDSTTISLIAIPKYRCPRCGGEISDPERKHPHLIPLDVVSLFFTILGQRLNKGLSRSIA